MSSLVRGPLPAGVYWRRRLVLLGLLLLLALGALRALGGGGADGAEGAASTVARDTTAPTPGGPAPIIGPVLDAGSRGDGDEAEERKARRAAERATRRAANAPLAEPEGRCSDADVVVTPVVEGAVAGQEVSILLNLRTLATAACTWQSGPAHLSVKITSGDDDVWSSQQCPGRLTRSEVTVRADSTTTTSLVWDARRSAADCPTTTPYAAPGYYHVIASSLGGEPNDVQFELVDPRDIVAEQVAAEEADAAAAAEDRREERRAERQGQRAGQPQGQPRGAASED